VQKVAKPVEMPFGVWSQVGQRNDVLGGGPDSHTREWAILRAKMVRPRTRLDMAGGRYTVLRATHHEAELVRRGCRLEVY